MKTLKITSINEILPKVRNFRVKVLVQMSEETNKIAEELKETMITEVNNLNDSDKVSLEDKVEEVHLRYTNSLKNDKDELPLTINFIPSLSKLEDKYRLELLETLESKKTYVEELEAIAIYLSKITKEIKMDSEAGITFNEFIGHEGELTQEVYLEKFYSLPMLRESNKDIYMELCDVKKILAST